MLHQFLSTLHTLTISSISSHDSADSHCLGIDFLELQTSPGPRIILVTSAAKFMIFVTSLLYIWSLVVRMTYTSLARSRHRDTHSSNPFYSVTYTFYIFMMLFCLARALYYATVILDGIVDIASIAPAEVLEFIQVLFYHSAR